MPTRTGKVRQERQPAAEDERDRHGARKKSGGRIGAEQEDEDEYRENARKQEAPEIVVALRTCSRLIR